MRRIVYLPICFLFLLHLVALPALAGEVIDGVVATVNHHAVLRSDWEEAVAFEAFMQQKPVGEISDAGRLLALQRLIDRQLLREQMGGDTNLQPSDARLQEDVDKLRAQLPDAKDDQSWRRLLAGYGLTEELVKEHLRSEFQVMNFVEVRLRPNVHIQDEEVEAYYKNQLLPDLQKNGAKIISLDEVAPKIHELLTQQRMDELLDAWLHNLRQQAEIHSSVPIAGITAPAGSAVAAGSN